jgi:hypothetical protein
MIKSQMAVFVAVLLIEETTSFTITCDAPFISSRGQLSSFVSRECTRMTGTLLICSLDRVGEDELHKAFGTVESISGDLIIRNSAGIKTLGFLSSLKEAGNVTLIGNRNLVDARVPYLERAGIISISRNDRLCPAWHLTVGTVVIDDSDCVSLDAEVLIRVALESIIVGDSFKRMTEFLTKTVFTLFPSNVSPDQSLVIAMGLISCR